MKSLWLVTSLLVCTASLQAQSAPHRIASSTARTSTESLSTTSLKVDGLNYGRDISRIYWGDFDGEHIDRNSLGLSIMIDTYMRNFGVACTQALPKNKVEIMNAECKTESYKVYAATGFEVPGTRSCLEDRIIGSGIYADPELVRGYHAQAVRMGAAIIRQLGSVMIKTGNEGINAAAGMNMQNLDSFRQAKDLASDMKLLIGNNACGEAPLRRFERNLIAYVTDISPIRMEGIPTSAGPVGDSDYQTLLDDLVAEQSNAWLMNHFQRDTIANVSVGMRDAKGRPTSISANYAYQTMGKQAEGKVELRFENGAPRCLVYADVPGTCRMVSPTIVAAYEDGKYLTARPASARAYVAPDLRQIQVAVDNSQPILVEIPGTALNTRQGIVVGTRGKLLRDVQGIGPSGSVVLVRTGSPVTLSVFNTQRSIKINLGRVGANANEAIDFNNTSKEFFVGADTLPRDGSPLRVSFDVPPDMQRTMLLTDFEKQKTVANTNMSPSTGSIDPLRRAANGNTDGDPRRVSGITEAHRVLLAGTLLQLEFASPITVGQAASVKLFPATVVKTRSSAITGRGRENLPEGTTVFVKFTQGNGRQYLIEADHAVIQGINVPLSTNPLSRVPMRPTRSAPVQIGRLGTIRIPGELQDAGAMVLVPAGTLINLTTKSNAALDAAPQ